MKWKILGLVVLLGGAFTLGWQTRPEKVPFPRVITDTVSIYRERPTVQIRWREKIRWRTVPPVTVTTGLREEKDTAAVNKYCKSAPDSSRADSAAGPRRAVLPDFRGRRTGDKVQLWSTLSDGRAYSAIYQVAGDRWQWLSNSDSTIWRQERVGFRLFRGLPGKILLVGGGYVLGKVF